MARISAIHPAGTDIGADDHIDAAGLHVFPGAIDPHIHLGGYQPLAVDTEPGTGLAALGGVTTLVNYFKATGSYLDLVPEYIATYEDGAYIDSAFHLQLLTEPHLAELAETTHRFRDHVVQDQPGLEGQGEGRLRQRSTHRQRLGVVGDGGDAGHRSRAHGAQRPL